jgi:hypothetical protein
VEEILAIAEVKERLRVFQAHEELAEMQIRRCATIDGNVVVADLRDEDPIYVCNRFLLYGIYPRARFPLTFCPATATTRFCWR